MSGFVGNMDEKLEKVYETFKFMEMIPPFTQIDSLISSNRQEINNNFDDYISITKAIYDIEFALANSYVGAIVHGWAWKDGNSDLLWSAYIKNLYTLYSAINLNNDGLVGSSRQLLRYTFEFAIIAKYVSLSNDVRLLDKWNNHGDIGMARDIFSKIIAPDSIAIKNVWKMLCGYAHSTKYSQQGDLRWLSNESNIKINYILFWMILEINYHLFNSHILNGSLKYYLKSYSDDYKKIIELKGYLKKLFTLTKKIMGNEPRKAIYDYKLTWQLKS